MPRSASRRQCASIACRNFFERPAGTLSGGQKQRLALAAATLHEPQLLLLDEPTSAVDPQSRRDFWESLFALTAAGTTILVSTHYMDEAERCHGLAILDLGSVVASGAPAQLMRDLPLEVVEIEAADTSAVRVALRGLASLRSLAQLGLRLHALLAPPARPGWRCRRGAPGRRRRGSARLAGEGRDRRKRKRGRRQSRRRVRRRHAAAQRGPH